MLAHTLRGVEDAPVRPIVLVTGAAHARIEAIARAAVHSRRRLRVRRNPGFATGMAGSLRRGLRALPQHCDFALIVLGDMPSLDRRLLLRLCTRARPGVDVVRPVHAGRPGHPVVIARRLFAEIDTLGGDRGAKTVIDRVPSARRVEIDAPHGHALDLDTRRAVRHWLRTRTRPSAGWMAPGAIGASNGTREAVCRSCFKDSEPPAPRKRPNFTARRTSPLEPRRVPHERS